MRLKKRWNNQYCQAHRIGRHEAYAEYKNFKAETIREVHMVLLDTKRYHNIPDVLFKLKSCVRMRVQFAEKYGIFMDMSQAHRIGEQLMLRDFESGNDELSRYEYTFGHIIGKPLTTMTMKKTHTGNIKIIFHFSCHPVTGRRKSRPSRICLRFI